MNEKTLTRQAFWAMVHRDLLVQWRNKWEFVFRVAMLAFILILVYGWMLPAVGILPEDFPTHMFCGMIGMSMLITGIHGTAVPIFPEWPGDRSVTCLTDRSPGCFYSAMAEKSGLLREKHI